jgi:uncharacterized protein YcbX
MSSPMLSAIHIYPVKSIANIQLSSALVQNTGLAYDRRFIVTRPDGMFITARRYPKLTLVRSALGPDGISLTAPGMPLLELNYSQFTNDYKAARVWDDSFEGQNCGNQASQWFSKYLGAELELLFMGDNTERPLNHYHAQQTDQQPIGDRVSFADTYPYLLISEASLQDLNRRLDQAVSMLHFRPNLVATGCEAYAEDSWQRIRVGEVEFEVAGPCGRCIFTTIDPESGEKDPLKQPLATLQNYRTGSDGEAHFGQHMRALNEGIIRQGDQLELLDHKQPEKYLDQSES